MSDVRRDNEVFTAQSQRSWEKCRSSRRLPSERKKTMNKLDFQNEGKPEAKRAKKGKLTIPINLPKLENPLPPPEPPLPINEPARPESDPIRPPEEPPEEPPPVNLPKNEVNGFEPPDEPPPPVSEPMSPAKGLEPALALSGPESVWSYGLAYLFAGGAPALGVIMPERPPARGAKSFMAPSRRPLAPTSDGGDSASALSAICFK